MLRNWYIIYTKPGYEKKVSALLNKKGYDSFCPLNQVSGNGSDRKKMSGEPLFPRYVFVCLAESQLLTVRNIPGVIQLLYWLSKPATIKSDEIKLISEFTSRHTDITVSKSFVDKEEECIVTHNPFLSPEAHATQPRKTCTRVLLPSLGYTLTAYHEMSDEELLTKQDMVLKMVS